MSRHKLQNQIYFVSEHVGQGTGNARRRYILARAARHAWNVRNVLQGLGLGEGDTKVQASTAPLLERPRIQTLESYSNAYKQTGELYSPARTRVVAIPSPPEPHLKGNSGSSNRDLLTVSGPQVRAVARDMSGKSPLAVYDPRS